MTSEPMAADMVAQIAAAPDDDAPRLVYADWLLTQGDPLGELIQVQCELSRLDESDEESPARLRLRRRENQLLQQLKPSFKRVQEIIGPHEYVVRRGFVERVTMTPRSFVDKADALFAAAPALTTVEFIAQHNVALEAQMKMLANTPQVARLRHVELPWFGESVERCAAVLAEAEVLAGLRSLKLSGSSYAPVDPRAGERRFDAAIARLVASPHLAGLEKLVLDMNPLGTDGVRAIAASRLRLVELSLDTCFIEREGGLAIAASPRMDRLRVLNLADTRIGAEATAALARSPHLAALERLNLSRCQVGFDGAQALGASPVLGRLRVLDLKANTVGGPKGVTALCAGGGLGALRELSLWQTRIKDEGVAALVDSPVAPHLAWLNLRSNQITDAGAKRIAGSPSLSSLRWINLNNNDIGKAGKDALAASEALRKARIYVDGGGSTLARAEPPKEPKKAPQEKVKGKGAKKK